MNRTRSSGDNIVAFFTNDSNCDTYILTVQDTTAAVEKEDITMLIHQEGVPAVEDEKDFLLLRRHSSEEMDTIVNTGKSIPTEIFCGEQSYCDPSEIFDVIFPKSSLTKPKASNTTITSSPPVSPGYQKRGRFLVWPVSPVAVTDDTTTSQHSVGF
jgi:hypothetical protein